MPADTSTASVGPRQICSRRLIQAPQRPALPLSTNATPLLVLRAPGSLRLWLVRRRRTRTNPGVPRSRPRQRPAAPTHRPGGSRGYTHASDPRLHCSGETDVKTAMGHLGPHLADLQEQLYAEGRSGGRRSLLLVLQGMDTAGKEGTVKHVLVSSIRGAVSRVQEADG